MTNEAQNILDTIEAEVMPSMSPQYGIKVLTEVLRGVEEFIAALQDEIGG